MTIRLLLFFSFLYSISFSLLAQTPTIQDCLGAIPVCNQIYMEDLSPVGTGNYLEINTNGTITCASSETNSIWYTFRVNQTGEFGFELTPNNSTDDYDWWLFDITNATCADINTNPNLSVSCNVAGGGTCDGNTGANGSTVFNIQGPGCNAFIPNANSGRTPFNDFVMVEAGNTYVLCVSNWTGSPFGYTLDFGLSGNIGIIDEIRPEISNLIAPTACDDNLLEVSFSENIQCSTIEAAHFQLSGPGGPYQLALAGVNCDNGGEYERTFQLTIDPAIQSLGDFTLEMRVDEVTDALDLCENPALPFSMNFEVTDPLSSIDIDIGNDTALVCVGDTLILDASFEGANYEWQDGSTEAIYTVTEGGIYTINVETSCGIGQDAIEVTYLETAPDINFGNDTILCTGESLLLNASYQGASYQWQDGSTTPTFEVTSSGMYAVTVSNACGVTMEAIEVTFDNNFELDLGPDRTICEGASLILSTNLNSVNLVWQDGSTAADYEVNESGTYYVTVNTSCTTQSDTVVISEVSAIQLDLGADTMLCPNETLLLDAFNEGATYQWQDGSTSPTFEVISSGTYAVTVSNACGVVTNAIEVVFGDDFALDLGPDRAICEGTTLTLSTNLSGIDFSWQDGSTSADYEVRESGTYYVTASTSCATQSDTIVIGEVAPPQLALGIDSVLCPNETLVLNAFNEGATYQWQNGSTAAQLEVTEPGTYAVTVSNACGTITDRKTIDVVAPIEIDLGVDTVLCPGEAYFLDAFSEAAQDYVWSDNSTKATNYVSGPGTYQVAASNACETVVEEIFIRECERCETYFPTAFSPDDDGVNDVFRPFSPCEMTNFNLKIFNRWGSLVFESQNAEDAWDGTFKDQMAAIGIYIWMVQYTVVEDFEERAIETEGELLLVR